MKDHIRRGWFYVVILLCLGVSTFKIVWSVWLGLVWKWGVDVVSLQFLVLLVGVMGLCVKGKL